VAIIGTAYVHIRADDKYFESDVRKAVAKIKNTTIKLNADVDLAKASKKIRDLRYRITSKDAVLQVDANVAKAEAKMSALLAKFLNKDINFQATADTAKAKSELAALESRFASKRVPFTAEANTTRAEALLGALTRGRRVDINPVVSPDAQKALMGLFNTLTGTVSAETIKGALFAIAGSFEAVTLKATAMITVVGAAAAELLTLGANAFSVAADLGQVVGLLGVFPAAVFGVVTAVKATTLAWKGFGDAMKEAKTKEQLKAQQEALAKLPPNAQKAVKALREIRGEIQKPVQKAYWEAMGTSLQDLIAKKFPELQRGMTDVGGAMGRYTAGLFNAIGNTADFNDIFVNVTDTIDNLVRGLNPAIDALSRWIGIGSNYLPRFGNWVSDLATKFDEWTKSAEETGKMNQWIETGIQRVKELASIVKSTAGVFSGLTRAAQVSGAPGLDDMATGLKNVSDIVNGEPFQSKLINVLEGARKGAERLGQGFKNLVGFIGDSSKSIEYFLDQAGEIAKLGFDSVYTLFNGTGLGFGLKKAMEGLSGMLTTLQTGFSDLGQSLGILGEIAGEVFKNMAPGLNQLFETIRKVLEELKTGIMGALPVFNRFIEGVMALVQGPLVWIADQVGNILEVFSKLPGGIQGAIMAFGLFLLLKGKLDGFFEGVKKNYRDMDSESGKRMRSMEFEGRKMVAGLKTSFDGFPASVEHAGIQMKEALKKNIDVAADYVPQRVKDMAAKTNEGWQATRAGFSQAWSDFGKEFDPVRTGFNNLKVDLAEKAEFVRMEWTDKMQRIGNAIAPADSGLRRFGAAASEMASRMDANLAPAREAVTNLAQHTATGLGNVGKSLGGGLKAAAGGLIDMLGGPWGIALAGATMALGMYAQAQQESAQKVDALSKTLNQQTGAISQNTKDMMATNALDGATSKWDDFWRGVVQGSKSTEETLGKLKISTKQYTDALSDPKGRDAYLKGMNDITLAMNTGQPVTEEMAKAIGTTKEALKGVTGNDMMHLAEKAGNAADELKRAEKHVKDVAEATGKNTIQAAQLAKNYDVLASSTSSVDEKVRALTSNLDIQQNGMMTAGKAAREHNKSMINATDSIKALGEGMVGVKEQNGQFTQSFKDNLLAIDGTFKNSTREQITFSEQMDAVAQSVMTVGMTEMKRLQDLGQKPAEAAQGALAKMNPEIEKVRGMLHNVGIDGELANQILSQIGLDPEKLTGALTLNTKDAEGELLRFSVFKDAVIAKNWEVALSASTDDVKNALLGVDKYREAYNKGGWEAVVKAKDETGKTFSDLMTKLTLAKDKSEVTAILKAEFKDSAVFKDVQDKIDGFDGISAKADLGIEPHNLELPDSLKQKLGEIDNTTATADITANDFTATAFASANNNKVMWNGHLVDPAQLKAEDLTGGVVVQAQSTIDGLHGVIRNLEAENATGTPTAQAQATLNSLKDVVRRLEGKDATLPELQAAQRTIDSLKGKEANLTANDQASEVVRNVNNAKLNDKSFNIMGVLTGVSDAVRAALGFAKGGIIDGMGVQQFANGGINMPNVKSFANGSENHVAQISRGAWPVRIWAEPETGGEAYLPLGKNKRARSLKILDQVADMFGYSLVKKLQFAEGGIMKWKMPSTTPSMVSGSDAVKTQVITAPPTSASAPTLITNVYPSAGLDEKQVASSVAENLYWKLSTQI
jgi:hypothetical protein